MGAAIHTSGSDTGLNAALLPSVKSPLSTTEEPLQTSDNIANPSDCQVLHYVRNTVNKLKEKSDEKSDSDTLTHTVENNPTKT